MRYISFLLVLIPVFGFSQTVNKISLSECYQAARENHPMVNQDKIQKALTDLKLVQLDLDKKPQLMWNARASFQSEAVSLNLPIPNLEPVDLPLLRGQTTLDATYTIYDGGMTEALKQQEQTSLDVKKKELEVTLHQVESQVNQYFFGVLLLREQIVIYRNGIKTIQDKIKQLEVGYENGVVQKTSIDRLKIEVLKLESQILAAEGDTKTLLAVLGVLTGKDFASTVELDLPNLDSFEVSKEGKHPEYDLFAAQKQVLLSKESLLKARQQPKVGAFLQAGVGYPNPLNFFDESVSPFAILGVQFSWNFYDWGKTDKERQTLSVSTQLIDQQKEAFNQKISLGNAKYEAEIEKIEALLIKDKEIIALHDAILENMDIQLKNGVITSTEFVTQLNEQQQTKLQFQLHQTLLQQTRVAYLRHKGLL